ncbi:MAG: flagellar hook-basal body complex protein FliE [Pseudomonadota bacterium]
MDVRSTQAARLYQTAQPATRAAEGAASAPARTRSHGEDGSFAAASGAALSDFAATLQRAERTAGDAMVGRADPHALVEALSQSELAVQTAVAVRDKVVEAYQEILRMPV